MREAVSQRGASRKVASRKGRSRRRGAGRRGASRLRAGAVAGGAASCLPQRETSRARQIRCLQKVGAPCGRAPSDRGEGGPPFRTGGCKPQTLRNADARAEGVKRRSTREPITSSVHHIDVGPKPASYPVRGTKAEQQLGSGREQRAMPAMPLDKGNVQGASEASASRHAIRAALPEEGTV